jgi:hypothetical protein
LCARILENPSIIKTQSHPTVVIWKRKDNDLNDLNDPQKQPLDENIEKNSSENPAQKIPKNGVGVQKDRSLTAARSFRTTKEIIFWSRFNELVQKSDDGTVKGQELRDNLVSSGEFYQGDATLFVEGKVRAGEVYAVEGRYDTYRIIKGDANS